MNDLGEPARRVRIFDQVPLVCHPVQLYQSLAFHLQFHLGIFLEDLRIPLPQKLRDSLIGDAAGTESCRIVDNSGEVFRSLQFALQERLTDDHYRRDMCEFASLPCFYFLAHRFEAALHAIDTDRNAVNQRE